MKWDVLEPMIEAARKRPQQNRTFRVDVDLLQWCRDRKIRVNALVNLLLRQAMEASKAQEGDVEVKP